MQEQGKPMTGPEHYREAERLSDVIKNSSAEDLDDGQYVTTTLAAAQVHATLALAAASALPEVREDTRPTEELNAAAAKLSSAADFLAGAVGTPPSGYPITRVLQLARAINGATS